MNDKTLYAIKVSAANESFELWVPDELSVSLATQLTINVLREKTAKQFEATAATSLYLKETGDELDINKLMGEYNFVDGTELVLI